MKINLNWNKIFLNIYPDDIMKQFKKVVLPFYFFMSFVLAFIILNANDIFISKSPTFSALIAWYFVFPIIMPICLLGLIFSTFQIIKNNNPLFLYHIAFKNFIIYVLNIGIFLPSLFLFLVFLTVILRMFHIT